MAEDPQKSPPYLGKHCLWKPQRGCCENQREGPKGVWWAGWPTSSFLTAKILLSEPNLDDPSKCMSRALICSLRARRTHLTYTCHHHVSGALTPGPKQNFNTRDPSPCSQHHQWHLIHPVPQTRNLGITFETSLSCTSPHPTYHRGLPTLPFYVSQTHLLLSICTITSVPGAAVNSCLDLAIIP